MLKLLHRLLKPRATARPGQPAPVPAPLTMSQLVPREAFEALEIGAPEEYFPEPEVDEYAGWEDYTLINWTQADGSNLMLVVIGQLYYRESYYYVCMTEEDMLAWEQGEAEDPSKIHILQAIPGVGGHDQIFYPVTDPHLHDAIYDHFMLTEEGDLPS